jgi:O-antigen ligase
MLTVLAALGGIAIAQLPLGTLVIVAGAVFVVVGALIEPLIGLMVTLLLAPWAAWQGAYLPGLLPTDVGQLALALTFAAWMLHGLHRREINIPRIALLIPLSIFTGWAAISMLWAPDYSLGLPEVLKWIEMILVALFVVDAAQRRGLVWIAIALLLSGLLQALVGIYEARLRGVGPEGFLLSEGVYRAYGSFEQPNPFAGFIGLILPLALALAFGFGLQTLHRARTRDRATWQSLALFALTSVIALALLAALYLSFSRGAWLGAVAAMLAMGLFLPKRRWIGLALIGGLLFISLLLYNAGLLPATIADRFNDIGRLANVQDVRGVKINDENYAVIERLAHWQSAVYMIEAQPWTGVGFSNYQAVYEQYRLLNWPLALGHAHNIYLNVAAETGLPGLAAYLFMWIAIGALSVRTLRRQHGIARAWVLGLIGAWVHLSTHHLFDNLYVNNVHLHIGALLGALCALAAPLRKNL